MLPPSKKIKIFDILKVTQMVNFVNSLYRNRIFFVFHNSTKLMFWVAWFCSLLYNSISGGHCSLMCKSDFHSWD